MVNKTVPKNCIHRLATVFFLAAKKGLMTEFLCLLVNLCFSFSFNLRKMTTGLTCAVPRLADEPKPGRSLNPKPLPPTLSFFAVPCCLARELLNHGTLKKRKDKNTCIEDMGRLSVDHVLFTWSAKLSSLSDTAWFDDSRFRTKCGQNSLSFGMTKVNARPFSPARPVLPIRCVCVSISRATS